MLDQSLFLEKYAHKIFEYGTRKVVSMQEIQKQYT